MTDITGEFSYNRVETEAALQSNVNKAKNCGPEQGMAHARVAVELARVIEIMANVAFMEAE